MARGRIDHCVIDDKLTVLGSTADTIFCEGIDDALLAIGIDDLAVRWRLEGIPTTFDGWTQSGAWSGVTAAGTFVHGARSNGLDELVARSPADGSVVARAPVGGHLAGMEVIGDAALVAIRPPDGPAFAALVELGEHFGTRRWTTAERDALLPEREPARWDRRSTWRPGDIIDHPSLGVGTVQDVAVNGVLVGFDAGGRLLRGAGGEPPATPPRLTARAAGRRARRYGGGLAMGHWAIFSIADERTPPTHKVKGSEAFELRDLGTGDEHAFPGPAQIECACAPRESTDRLVTGISFHAADERGALFSPYGRGHADTLYEIDAMTGRIRWAATPPTYPLLVRLADRRVVLHDEHDADLVGVDREDGHTVWTTACARDPVVTLTADVVYVAHGGEELRLAAIDLETGALRWRRERIGLTFPGGSGTPELVPTANALLIFVRDRRVTHVLRLEEAHR